MTDILPTKVRTPYSIFPNSLFNEFFADIDDVFSNYKTNAPYDVYNVLDKDGVPTAAHIKVALAGYDKSDISIKCLGAELMVEIKKTTSTYPAEQTQYVHKGIAERSTQLKFKLTGGYKLDAIKSSFINGMLIIEIPIDRPQGFDVTID